MILITVKIPPQEVSITGLRESINRALDKDLVSRVSFVCEGGLSDKLNIYTTLDAIDPCKESFIAGIAHGVLASKGVHFSFE